MIEAELIAIARALASEFRTGQDCVAGGVAAAVLARSGRVFTGVCVDATCSLGLCAEQAAVAEMLKARESEIAMVVAVSATNGVVAPCGRCRELFWQLNPANRSARVIVGPLRIMTLAELLPEPTRG